MKQILVGRGKGYLIPKKVVEDKLREKFGIPENSPINSVMVYVDNCSIHYLINRPKIEKKEDYFVIDKKPGVHESGRFILVENKIFMELFGLKENLLNIWLKYVRDGKVIHEFFYNDWDYLFDKEDLYYFFEIGEQDHSHIGEIKT